MIKKESIVKKAMLILVLLIVAFGIAAVAAATEKLPAINFSYGLTTHHQGFTVTLQKGETFKEFGFISNLLSKKRNMTFTKMAKGWHALTSL